MYCRYRQRQTQPVTLSLCIGSEHSLAIDYLNIPGCRRRGLYLRNYHAEYVVTFPSPVYMYHRTNRDTGGSLHIFQGARPGEKGWRNFKLFDVAPVYPSSIAVVFSCLDRGEPF